MRRGTTWPAIALVAVASLAAGCASPPPPAISPEAEPAYPLSEAAADAIAEMLEMQDRGQLRTVLLAQYALADEPAVRAQTALTIARVGDRAGGPLARSLLADPDTAVAASAAFAAGQLRDSAAVDRLLARLAPPRDTIAPTVAAEAARALGRIGSAAGDQAIANYLLGVDSTGVERNLSVVQAALAAAATRGAERWVFARWLSSADPRVRWLAADGLAREIESGGADLLLPLLEDPAPLVRSAALRAASSQALRSAGISLESVLPRLFELRTDTAYSIRIQATRALASHSGPQVDSVLRSVIREGRPHERIAAIEALHSAGDVSTGMVAVIRSVAVDAADHPFVRARAAAAAIALEPAGADGLIARLLDDGEWRVRAALADAVAASQGQVLAPLERLVRDEDPRVARAAVQAVLTLLDTDRAHLVRPLLIEAAHARDTHVRAAAIDGLGSLADLNLFPILLDAYAAAEDDLEAQARLAAVDAIAALSGAGIPAPERAFFARFGPSQDERVRERVYARFGAAARRYWGAPLPVESPRGRGSYREMVARWIAPADPAAARPSVVVVTGRGEFEMELLSDRSPLIAANFLALVDIGYFEGQEIASLSPANAVHAGAPAGDLAAGPGYTLRPAAIRAEFGPGAVAMRASGTAVHGSQFFVMLSPDVGLYGELSLFGRVVAGQDVLETILPGDAVLSVAELEEEE